MNRRLRTLVLMVVVVLICAPVSLVVTLILIPFWRWLESRTGLESIGHSGPAEWCYLSVFILVAGGSLLGLWILSGRRRSVTGGD